MNKSSQYIQEEIDRFGRVELQAGDHVLHTPIVLRTSETETAGWSIRGAGMDRTRLIWEGNGPCVVFEQDAPLQSSYDSELSNLSFSCQDSAISLTAASHVRISNVRFTLPGVAIQIRTHLGDPDQNAHVNISHCEFRDCAYGVRGISPANQLAGSPVEITHSYFVLCDVGVLVNGSWWRAVQNRFNQCGDCVVLGPERPGSYCAEVSQNGFENFQRTAIIAADAVNGRFIGNQFVRQLHPAPTGVVLGGTYCINCLFDQGLWRVHGHESFTAFHFDGQSHANKIGRQFWQSFPEEGVRFGPHTDSNWIEELKVFMGDKY